jgi:hypothetical protein
LEGQRSIDLERGRERDPKGPGDIADVLTFNIDAQHSVGDSPLCLDDLLNLIGGEHAPLATVMVIVSDGGRCQRRRCRQHATSGGSAAKRQDTTTTNGQAGI